MKILIVSDSHGNDEILRELYKMYPNMDYYLHAGDSQSSLMAIYPFDSVLGNCDFYDFDLVRKISTPKGYLLMRHYPKYSKEEIKDVKFFIHGHTHVARVKKENELYVICPGSVSLPRDGTNGTYMIIEINENSSTITTFDVETKNILTREKIM